jgi:hypothetical protein
MSNIEKSARHGQPNIKSTPKTKIGNDAYNTKSQKVDFVHVPISR